MKNRFLSFLKRYYILIILSLLHPLAIITVQYWGGIVISRGVLGPFRTSDFYLIFIMPIFHFIYGCIAYKITKKIFIPSSIVILTNFVFLCLISLVKLNFSIDMIMQILLFPMLTAIFSMIGAGITAFIYRIIRSMREKQN